MGNWGIASNSEPQEKIKSDMEDFLHGLNSCGEISYKAYSEILDVSMDLLNKMYSLGKEESSKIVNVNNVETFIIERTK